MRALIALFATLSILVTGGTSLAAKETASQIVVQVISCVSDLTLPPVASLADASEYPALKFDDVNARATSVEPGLFTLTLSVPWRNTFIKVESPHCSNQMQLGTIPGLRRVVSIALLPHVVTLHGRQNALMGLLPVTPSAAFLVSASGSKRTLDVQDGAYYIERTSPGRYLIRLELHGGFQSDIPIDLSTLGDNAAYQFDVGLTDLRKHLGSILIDGGTLQKCQWCADSKPKRY